MKRSHLFKFLSSYLIFSLIVFNVSPVFSQGLSDLSPEDIKAAKEMLKDSGEEEQPETFYEEGTELPVDEDRSDIEKAMSDGLPKGQVLNQFGYETFNKVVSTSSPVPDAPVGPDYIVGPGDAFTITLWGISEGAYKVEVNREGNITIPKAGVIHVAGLTFGELKPYILSRLSRYYERINLSVAMNNVRTIRVFVLGEVAQPGSYSVSSLSTVFTALFAAGGPTKQGTMRNILLRRNNKTIAKVDIYDFLLYGDRSGDMDLQSGDVIFVPLIGRVAGVAGSVKRPGIFEIGKGATLVNILDLAGGALTTAMLNRVQIKRVLAHEKTVVMDRNLKEVVESEKFLVEDMDRIEVFPIFSGVENQVNLEGKAKYPGSYELKPGMKLKDILPSRDALLLEAYLDRAEIVRLSRDKTKVEVIDFSLSKLFTDDPEQNIELKPFDRIVVYTEARSIETVSLMGEVKRPGTYTIMKGEKLSSLLKRAGGFTKDSFVRGAIFTRKSVAEMQQERIDQLVDELQSRLILSEPDAPGEVQVQYEKAKDLLSRLRKVKAQGRVVVKLDRDLDEFTDSSSDMILEEGDEIVVPQRPSIVNVMGQVYNPTALVYEKDKNASYYLNKVGGPTKMADRDAMFIVLADGTVISKEQRDIYGIRLGPGDSILVPPKYEFFDMVEAIKDIVDIMFKVASTAGMVKVLLQ